MNKHGFIFTLDAVVGMTVLFMVVMLSLFFISKGSEVTLTEQQVLRVGSDVVTILDNQKVLDTLDYGIITTKMEEVLPPNYGMLLRIQGNFAQGNGTIEVGGEIPNQRFVLSGRRVALTEDNTYLQLTYWVWTRGQ